MSFLFLLFKSLFEMLEEDVHHFFNDKIRFKAIKSLFSHNCNFSISSLTRNEFSGFKSPTSLKVRKEAGLKNVVLLSSISALNICNLEAEVFFNVDHSICENP